MKELRNLIFVAFLLAIPIASESRTVAFSPSIPGQPLIFHFNTALNQIQPSQYSAVTWTQLENALLIQSSYSQHLDNLPERNCCTPWNVWADGMGMWQHQDSGDKHQFGFDTATGGVTVGADTYFNDFLVGAAGSYTYTNLRWKQSVGNSEINSYYGGLYGRWNQGCFYVNAALMGAYSDYRTSRHFFYRTIDYHARASHNSWEGLAGVEGGLILEDLFCSINVVPFVDVDYIYLSQQGYSENGADIYNLSLNSRSDQLIQSEIGFQFMRQVLCGNSWIFAPNLSLSYINQSPLTDRSYLTSFVDRGGEIGVKGWEFERNLGAVGINFNFFDCAQTLNFALYYDGQFGKNYWNQTGGVMFDLSF